MSQFSNDATGRGQLTYSFLPLRLSPSAYHKKRSRGAKVQQLFSPSRVSKWFEPRVAAVSKGRLGLTELEEKWAEWSDSGFAEDDTPSLQECFEGLTQACKLALRLPIKERLFEVSKVRCIGPLVKSLVHPSTQLALQEMEGGELARLTASVAVLGGRLNYTQEVDMLLKFLQPEIAGLDASVVPVLLWSCAKLNVIPHALFSSRSTANIVSRTAKALALGDIITCLWSLAILKKTEAQLFHAFWQRLSVMDKDHRPLTPKQRMQVYQVSLAVRYEGSTNVISRLPALPMTVFPAEVPQPLKPQVSGYQRQLAACLTSLGIAFQQEVDLQGLAIDFYIPTRNTVVEFDGPSHFARNSEQALGPTAFKRRLLQAMGMRVISITTVDWDDLMVLSAQRRFLEAALSRHI